MKESGNMETGDGDRRTELMKESPGVGSMNSAKLTIGLILVAVVLVVAVPQFRAAFVAFGRFFDTGGSKPTRAEYRTAVMRYPDDADVWIAFAEVISMPEVALPNGGAAGQEDEREWTAEKAYQKAITIAPDAPGPYLRYAQYLLRDTTLGRSEELGVPESLQSDNDRSEKEVQRLQEALGLLEKAGKLDEDNAAPNFLRAYCHLALRKDHRAVTALESAIAKPHWDLAARQAATGMLRLVEAAGISEIQAPSAALAYTSLFSIHSQLRTLTRTMVGLGDTLREKGKHEQAITYFEASMHLGRLMRQDAYTLIEGLVGIAVTRMVSGPFISEAEKDQIEESTTGKEERYSRLRRERAQNMGAYLRKHGHPELAQLYQSEVQKTEAWREDAEDFTRNQMGRLLRTFYAGNAKYLWVLSIAAAGFAALWLLTALISLAARYWREKDNYPVWTYLEWGAAMAASVLGGTVSVVLWPSTPVPAGYESPHFMHEVPGIFLAAAVAVVLWLLAVLVMALRRRGRLLEEERPGKIRTYLAALRTLLPPTFAAFLLMSVIARVPAHRQIQHWTDRQHTVIEQGEVEYYNIGDDSPDRTSAVPQLRQSAPVNRAGPQGEGTDFRACHQTRNRRLSGVHSGRDSHEFVQWERAIGKPLRCTTTGRCPT